MNGRFMELQIRLLVRSRPTSSPCAKSSKRVGRGSVTVQGTLRPRQGPSGRRGLDQPRRGAPRSSAKAAGISDELILSDLLRWAATARWKTFPESQRPRLEGGASGSGREGGAGGTRRFPSTRRRRAGSGPSDSIVPHRRIRLQDSALARATLKGARESGKPQPRIPRRQGLDEARVAQKSGTCPNA
ncbi:MAG: hypothetical protein IPN71_08870 [Fibrobacteres bacterium]|nr:hypothetical protein [Fibrobacterota bacterium]